MEDVSKSGPISAKSCFVIIPIGEKGSPTRRRTENLLRMVIRPVLETFHYRVQAAHEMPGLGSITNQIIRRVVEDDLVIADLTDLNPNVMYELGLRHMARRPVVTIAEVGTKLPFDVASQRAVLYEPDFGGAEELKAGLSKAVESAAQSERIDNPVTAAQVESEIMSSLVTYDFEYYVIHRFDRIEAMIEDLAHPNDESAGFSFEDLLQDPRHYRKRMTHAHEKAARAKLFLAVESLDDLETMAITKSFGLDGQQPMSVEQIAESEGIRASNVLGAKERALLKLRSPELMAQIEEEYARRTRAPGDA